MIDPSSHVGRRRWFINSPTWLIAVPVLLVGLVATAVTAQPLVEGSVVDVGLVPSAVLLIGAALVMRYATLTVGPRVIVVRTMWGRKVVDLDRVRDVRVVQYSHWMDTRNMISLVVDSGETVLVKGLTDSAGLPALGFARRAREIAAAAGIESSERLAELDPVTGRLVYLEPGSPDLPHDLPASRDAQTFGRARRHRHHRAMLAVSLGILSFVVVQFVAGPVLAAVAGVAVGLAVLWRATQSSFGH